MLTLTFDKDIEGLTVEDIAVNAGTTGITKETLSPKGSGVYELEVSGITESGTITVTVSKAEYIISPASLNTAIYYYTGNVTDTGS
jgi:secreted protein with Ig-like and vWFA domain